MADDVIKSLYLKELRTTKFGMAGKEAQGQTSDADQVALPAYGTGAFGLDSDANMAKLVALVVEMRAALVANGTIKGSA